MVCPVVSNDMADSASTPADGDRVQASPAEILAPGPVLALGAFAVGFAVHLLLPLSVLPTPWNAVAGGVLVVVGMGLLLWGLVKMRAIDKSPNHEDEPTALITDGPFRYTRNPLYLALIVVYLGLTAILNSPWPLVPLVVLVWYFDRMAKREEEYLEAVFGDEFVEYSENVRRWL